MASREDTAAKLMLVSAMMTKLKAVGDQLRAEMDGMVKVGAVEPVTLPSNGQTVGKVRKDAGAATVSLNWPRLTEWCREHYPATVRQAWEILPGYQARLLAAAKSSGIGVDPETGETLPDSCYTVAEGAPKIVVSPTRGRDDLLTSYLVECLTEAGRLLDSHQPKGLEP